MKENCEVKSMILLPLQLAEDANRGFVKVVQQLFRLVNYDFHTIRSKNSNSSPHDVTTSRTYQPVSDFSTGGATTQPSSKAPQPSTNDNTDSSVSQDDEPVEIISHLFSDIPEQRLSAVRWISDQQYRNALPMLESILLIEDDYRVYDEVCKLLKVFRDNDYDDLNSV